jgi:hypothetical protein
MSEVRPEEDVYFKAISAVDRVVIQVKDVTTAYQTLLRLRQHLDARIEQSKPPTEDWLE